MELTKKKKEGERMEMSNLSIELAGEVLSKLPFTSLRAMRLTCKNWNNLSKTPSFARKHIGEVLAREFLMIMVMDYKVYLMGLSLHNNVDPSIKHKGKLIISPEDSDQVDISQVFHCDGLLLCVTKDKNKRLVVWNPYLGQKRWIKSYQKIDLGSNLETVTTTQRKPDHYAIGYEMKKNKYSCHKIFKFSRFGNEIFDVKSNSWRETRAEASVEVLNSGVSVKGNTYWICSAEMRVDEDFYFLMCFDFTSERFGPRLRLPPYHNSQLHEDTVTLSSVKEEKLAVLFKELHSSEIEIWITTEINPEAVSWSKLIAVNIRPSASTPLFCFPTAGLFIDEEKKVAVVIDKNEDYSRNVAYIIGMDGYITQVEVTEEFCRPLMCSYVPSLMHIS